LISRSFHSVNLACIAGSNKGRKIETEKITQ